MIGTCPLTRESALQSCESYIDRKLRWQAQAVACEVPHVLPRWLRTQCNIGHVLRHSGRYSSSWEIVSSCRLATAERRYQQRAERFRFGGLALVVWSPQSRSAWVQDFIISDRKGAT